MTTAILDSLFGALLQTGVTIGLLAALGFLFRTWITTRLTAAVNFQYAAKLEEIRANVSRLASAEAVGTGAFSDAEVALQPRRIQAADRLWSDVVERTRRMPMAVYLADILTETELTEHAPKPGVLHDAFDELVQRDSITGPGDKLPDGATEQVFVNGDVWRIYSAHWRVLMRMTFLLQMAQEGRRKFDWSTDEFMDGIIRDALSPSEYQQFNKLVIGRIDFVLVSVQNKLSVAIGRMLSGHAASERALAHADSVSIEKRARERRREQFANISGPAEY